MALLSPGVEITFIDESFYNSSIAGSIPLIVIATAENKTAPSGVGIAPMTTKARAGKLYRSTSQRDLAQAFGSPLFYSVGGTPQHGYELNEYGLHAANSFLGISTEAYILRADIDTNALRPNSTKPVGLPKNGTFWFDTASTSFGLFQSNGNSVPGSAWVSQSVLVATSTDTETATVDSIVLNKPVNGFGSNGNFAIAIQDTRNFIFEKINGAWYKIGSAGWKGQHPTIVRSTVNPASVTTGHSFLLNGVTVTLTGGNVSTVANDITSALATASVTNVNAIVSSGALVITNTTGGDLVIANGTGTALTTLGISAKTYHGVKVVFTNDVSYPTGSVVGDLWVKGTSTNKGANFALKIYNATSGVYERVSTPFFAFDSTISDGTTGKDTAALAAGLTTTGSIYVGYDTSNGVIQFRRFNGSNFATLSYEASDTAPTGDTPADTLWYSTDFQTDIMVSDGVNYRGYRNVYPNTDPAGVLISGSAPTKQSDGSDLVQNDLWINTTELNNYPRIRRYDATLQKWLLVDNTDQTSPFGIIFADARQDSGTAFSGQVSTGYVYGSTLAADMLVSDFLDPDAPDGRTVPAGMMLFNTRFSTYNVKQWKPDYFKIGGWDADTNYTTNTYYVGGHGYVFPALTDAGRWVTVSGNATDGSPYMGRRAQRAMITRAMAEAISASDDARSEVINFNLIAAPGYPELIDEMVTLNFDQKNTAFVVGDTPVRLGPDANSVVNWATNSSAAASNGELGLTSSSSFVGVYYPWGLSTNSDGTEVMVPPSTMALRVMAYNDQVAYPWFAPAGLQRGLVTNASSVGYLTSEGEFQTLVMSQGFRDAIYTNKINPIYFVPNRGLAVMGQKTLSPTASALDRVNVARLCNYLASALYNLSTPFIMQPNDQQTRDGFKAQLDRFFSGLIGLRAIQDFAVQCDTTNNTQDRINRNELWADVAILPTKAVEFIYVPVRLTNDTIT